MGFSRDIYLIGIASVYLIAFCSLYVQIPGLYGDHGLLPVKNVVSGEPKDLADFLRQPSLIRYRYKYYMDTESALDLCCLVGAAISLLAVVFESMRSSLVFITLWMLYMSLYAVGQTFISFQWDILLLEAGFLAVIIAPLQLLGLPTKHHHDKVSMWLVKWLLFRLMYASGVAKLQSGCKTWWGLTALDWHFESQCLPTPLAWYFHHTPDWFRKFSNASVFIIQIAISFLFFAPTKSLRMFSFYAQVALQFLILLTGNYNFFNLLTLILCFSLLDDDDSVPARRGTSIVGRLSSYLSTLFTMLVLAVLIVYSNKYFGISIKGGIVYSNINFTQKGFDVYIYYATAISIWLAVASLGWEIATSLYKSMTAERGFVRILYSVFSTLVLSTVVVYMFSISLVPHTVIERSVQSQLPPVIHKWHSHTDNLQLVNSYGLFRSMTGIGGRPEVVVMGSNDRTNWKEYEFLYKPGQLDRRPPVVAPHQPRLDWQMWFAALGSYQHNHWFITLLYRLLDNEPAVLDLLQKNPFPERAPKYIKAQLYTYHFSSMSARRNWWMRDDNPQEYTPILSKDDTSLLSYLTDRKILPVKARYKPYGQLDSGLRYIRSLVDGLDHFLLVTAVTLLAVLYAFMSKLSH